MKCHRSKVIYLKSEVFERLVAVGIAAESGQTGDPLIGNVPAGPEIEALQFPEPPGDQHEARVGDVAAAAQIEILQITQVLADPAETRVGDLLAQTQIQSIE